MHWTYEHVSASHELAQGDILSPTPQLKELLKDIHPHFYDDKYMGFMVTTQSCDLVRRSSAPKAPYINIASIRSLKEIGPRLLRNAIKNEAGRIFYQSEKQRAMDLFGKIFNQNEQSLGLFYLHPSPDLGLGDHAVALLRVTVSLKADHYDVLLKARVGTLTPEFRAKFGWLVGNLYSRAATRDWQDSPDGTTELKELVRTYTTPADSVLWVDDTLIESARSKGIDVSQPLEEITRALESLRPPSSTEILMEEVAKQIDALMANRNPFWKGLEEACVAFVHIINDSGEDEEAKHDARVALQALVKSHFLKLNSRLSNSAVTKTILK